MKFAATILTSLLACAATALPQTASKLKGIPKGLPTRDITIGKIGYGGSGCPAGTVSVNFNNDRTAFTLLFDEYIASKGPGIPLTESRKSCQLSVPIVVPQGWTFAVMSVDYRGFLDLEEKVTGYQNSLYYYQGEFRQARLRTQYKGPIVKDYTIRDEFFLVDTEPVWHPCGEQRNVNIQNSIYIRSRDRRKSGMMTVDSADGKVKQIWNIYWKKCDGGKPIDNQILPKKNKSFWGGWGGNGRFSRD